MNSIMQNVKYCYICGNTNNLHKHHIMKGVRNRNKAEQDGLWVWLCYQHHEGTNGVHGKNGHELDLYLIKQAEEKYLVHYNKTIDDFVRRYGKNYI